ncbi:MAG: DegT/DnrJ/EryC1/StrS aminotransferase family protein [Desulfovibrionaceae bacterium]|nr:DegT/DnrJ/EryC1/StrS aminotransferase family protein [Desulfovibrionaceae bacterium]MBF0512689.1 DegT/DnrJ/EryC1/StrS aminotransferase family protein [Desulfovibrionaceae bacterium]
MSPNWPLMHNNIVREDLDALIDFLRGDPILTASSNVRAFEEEWSRWLGVRHSVFLNSGSSANLITLAALRHTGGAGGEIILPPLGWISDVTAVLLNGFTPVFADIDPRTLALDDAAVIEKITDKTRAVLLIHIQGFNGLTARLRDELKKRGIALIEDVCESHGAVFEGEKCGSFGLISNFSFYYAHHMSTIEGGMACTDDPELYETLRMLRAHGLAREMDDPRRKRRDAAANPELSRHFIFNLPGYNMRNTEIGAVLGRRQLTRLDGNNALRRRNLDIFLAGLDPEKYQTDFAVEGSCNYAFNLILKNPDAELRARVEAMFEREGIENRRGSSGGGNQLRQPYLKGLFPEGEHLKYPRTEHVHFFGYYLGNYPGLEPARIQWLCDRLNAV